MVSRSLALIAICAMIGVTDSLAQEAAAQRASREFSIAAGLGVAAHSAQRLNDYINAIGRPGQGQRLDDFASAAEFFVRPELRVSEDWVLGLEYSLLVKSYALGDASGYSRSEFSYHVHMPTLLLEYLVPGEGYRLKFGGGAGYHVATFSESFPSYGTQDDFSAGGLGLKLNAVGNTKFDETFYGLIEVDLRWDFLGTLKNKEGAEAVERTTSTTAKMNFFNVGIKFGVLFQL